MILLNKGKKNRAFTLIELMVASTLFTVIMMIGIGSLVMSSDSARASQKLRTAVDNVNFAMESMARELRMGTYYYCGTGDVSMANDKAVLDCMGGDVILFKPAQQQVGSIPIKRVGYYKEARTDGSYTLVKCEETASNCYPIVSSDVNVETLKFYVKGSKLNDKIQPSVKILMKGTVKLKGVSTPFALQTMASQRSTEK